MLVAVPRIDTVAAPRIIDGGGSAPQTLSVTNQCWVPIDRVAEKAANALVWVSALVGVSVISQ